MNKQQLFPAIGVIMVALALAAGFNVSAQESDLAKTGRLINESGITYTKVNETTWTSTFTGKSIKDIPVAMTSGDGIFIAFTLLKETKGVKLPGAALLKLLNLNEDLDRVKIGVGADGQVSIRVDVSLRTLDKEDVSVMVNQVAAAADEVHIAIKQYLPKAK